MVNAFLITALFQLVSLGAWAADSPASVPALPDGWNEFVEADQNHNISAKDAWRMSANEKRIQPIFHWDVPAEKVDKLLSRHLDEETRNRVMIHKNGKDYIRFFMAQEDFTDVHGMIREFGQPETQHFWGTKMQSKGTYFVWDPSHPHEDPFFVKMQRAFKAENVTHTNTWMAAKNAVLANDAIEDIFKENKYDGADGSVFPERFASGVKTESGFSYANSLRSAFPLESRAFPRGVLYPNHAVFGSPIADDFAKAAGMSKLEWIQKEYFPALARHEARMNLSQNIYLEDHTQNTILEVDPHTGKVLAVHSRDLADSMIDPVGKALSGTTHRFTPESLPYNILNERFVEAPDGDEFRPGTFFSHFTLQSVTSIFPSENETRFALVHEFVQNYLKEAEKILGKPLVLSAEGQNRLAGLLLPPKKNFFGRSDASHRYPWVLNNNYASTALMQEIHELSIQARFEKARPNLYVVPELQEELKRAWNHSSARLNSPFHQYSENTPHSYIWAYIWAYIWDGAGILAVDSQTNALMAYSYALPEEEYSRIAALARLHPPRAGEHLGELKKVAPPLNSPKATCLSDKIKNLLSFKSVR
jgi:hypothetical protein